MSGHYYTVYPVACKLILVQVYFYTTATMESKTWYKKPTKQANKNQTKSPQLLTAMQMSLTNAAFTLMTSDISTRDISNPWVNATHPLLWMPPFSFALSGLWLLCIFALYH